MEPLPSILDLERQLGHIEAPRTEGEALAQRIARALLRHVRNFGTPQTAPMSPKLAAQSLPVRGHSVPAHLMRPRAQTLLVQPANGFVSTPARPARPAMRSSVPKSIALQDGVTIKQIAARAGFSTQHVANLLWAGVLPKPQTPAQGNRGALWSEAGAAAVLEILADPERRKKPSTAKTAVPDHWVSAEQFAQRLGYSHANMIHHLVGVERIPAHEFKQGRRVYWSDATVTATQATYKRRQRIATSKEPA